MNYNLFFVAFAVALLFEGFVFLALSLIYKSEEKKSLRILNTFIYEVSPSFRDKHSYLNYLLFFGVLVSIFPYIYYLFYNVQIFSMTIFIVSVILAFCLCTVPFIPLNKLREHFYLALGGLLMLFVLFTMEGYYCFTLYRLYLSEYQLAAMIVAIVFALLVLAVLLNPKLFDLKNKKNDSGETERKKFILLAFSEWMLYPLSILAIVPMLLISM